MQVFRWALFPCSKRCYALLRLPTVAFLITKFQVSSYTPNEEVEYHVLSKVNGYLSKKSKISDEALKLAGTRPGVKLSELGRVDGQSWLTSWNTCLVSRLFSHVLP